MWIRFDVTKKESTHTSMAHPHPSPHNHQMAKHAQEAHRSTKSSGKHINPKGLPAGIVPNLIGAHSSDAARVIRYIHSYNENGTVAGQMQEKPRDLFERVFGTIQIAGEETNLRSKRLKQSVLDSVVGQYKFYTGKNSPLGKTSRARVADHLDRIREYEQRAYKINTKKQRRTQLTTQVTPQTWWSRRPWRHGR